MISHIKQLKLLNSEVLIIIINKEIIPLRGLTELIDWQISSQISKSIRNKILNFDDNNNLMLNTQEKLSVNKTIIMKNNKDTISNILNTLEKINAKNFTLLIPNTIPINLKSFLKSLKTIKHKKLSTMQSKEERLVFFKEVEYGKRV